MEDATDDPGDDELLEREDFPAPPRFEASDWEKCAAAGDYRDLALGWYRYVAQLASVFASIRRESPCIGSISPVRWAVLTALLFRCARLMHSNLFLATRGPFRETTSILDRCILESCVKLMWLCRQDPEERLRRFLATSLDTDVGWKREIEEAIAERGGTVWPIEHRMLETIAEFVASAGMTDDEVRQTKKLPSFKQMVDDVGLPKSYYEALQRQGSHAVHGTWQALRKDYLESDAQGGLRVGGNDYPTSFDQFTAIMAFVLMALNAFAEAVVAAGDDAIDGFKAIFDEAHEAIGEVVRAAVSKDFEPDAKPRT